VAYIIYINIANVWESFIVTKELCFIFVFTQIFFWLALGNI